MSTVNTTWLELIPVDTLFFRGTESMVAGENHEVDTMFPPMPHTMVGALRTAIMAQNGIAPTKYLTNPERIKKEFPILGDPDKPGFSVLGPLLSLKQSNAFYPAPAHWMGDIKGNMEEGTAVLIQAAMPLETGELDLMGNVMRPFWVKKPMASELKFLSGFWVTKAAFDKMKEGMATLIFHKDPALALKAGAAFVPFYAFILQEERVGIALDRNRTVRPGHLFSARHIRFRADVKMVIKIETIHTIPLSQEGILQLGGEQRVCSYKILNKGECPTIPQNPSGKCLYSFTPILADRLKNMRSCPRCSGKLLRVGGWDMKRRFHKALSAWFPPGIVLWNGDQGIQTQDELREFIPI